jgi:hypothetical protein
LEAKRLWHWGSEHVVNWGSDELDVVVAVSEGKNVWLFVRNGGELFAISSFIVVGRLFKRFDCLDLILQRSLRSSSPDKWLFDVICWHKDTDCWYEQRLFPPAPVRFVRLVLLLLRGS